MYESENEIFNEGKDIDWNCLVIKYWGEYLNLRNGMSWGFGEKLHNDLPPSYFWSNIILMKRQNIRNMKLIIYYGSGTYTKDILWEIRRKWESISSENVNWKEMPWIGFHGQASWSFCWVAKYLYQLLEEDPKSRTKRSRSFLNIFCC
jgi:hypothetical protein